MTCRQPPGLLALSLSWQAGPGARTLSWAQGLVSWAQELVFSKMVLVSCWESMATGLAWDKGGGNSPPWDSSLPCPAWP